MRAFIAGCALLLLPAFFVHASDLNHDPDKPNACNKSSILNLDEGTPSQSANNIITTLCVDRTRISLGEPITASLHATNIGNETVTFYFHDMDHLVFSIDALDGHKIPYVGGLRPPQPPPIITIRPGNTAELCASFDLTKDFLVSLPGQYTLCSRFAEYQHFSLPPSNEVTVTVEPGELPTIDKILDRLLQALPDGWTILWRSPHETKCVTPAGRKEAVGCLVSMMGGGAWLSKGRYQRVVLWQTEVPAEPDPDYDYEKKNSYDGPSTFIGKSKYGYLYIWAVTGPADLEYCWPDPIASLKAVLMQE